MLQGNQVFAPFCHAITVLTLGICFLSLLYLCSGLRVAAKNATEYYSSVLSLHPNAVGAPVTQKPVNASHHLIQPES